MANDGFIFLFRQFQSWQHYQEGSVKSVFLDLLLSVNYEPSWFRGERVEKGCTAMSISTLQEHTGLSRSVVVKALKILEKTGEISRFKSKFGIVTKVNNFSEFQDPKNRGSSFFEPPSEPASELPSEPASELPTEPPSEPPSEPASELLKQRNKEIIYNNIIITPSKEGESAGADPPPPEPDLKAIVDFFNKSVIESNSVIPKIKGASGKRVGYIKARIREYGIEAIYEVITKATQSDFMNGRNQRGWVATFDWMFLPTYFPKVLEGNYDNRPITVQSNGTNFKTQSSAYYHTGDDGRDQRSARVAATIASRLAESAAREAAIRNGDAVPDENVAF